MFDRRLKSNLCLSWSPLYDYAHDGFTTYLKIYDIRSDRHYTIVFTVYKYVHIYKHIYIMNIGTYACILIPRLILVYI
jgi:hypothetical protein